MLTVVCAQSLLVERTVHSIAAPEKLIKMGWLQLLLFLCSVLDSFSFPQTPFFDFQAFPVPAVTPSSIHPAPQYKSYDPVYHKPEPVQYKSKHSYHQPKPVYHHHPKPVYHQSKPTYHKPLPIYHKPAQLYTSAGPPYYNPPSYTPTVVPKVYTKHPPAYPKPGPLPPFVNLGPSPYQPTYTTTAAPAEEPAPDTKMVIADVVVEVAEAGDLAEEVEDVENVVAIMESDKSSNDSQKPEKLVIFPETTTKINLPMLKTISTKTPKTDTKITVEDLVDMAVERLQKIEENIKVMEEIEEDGLVVLEPQSAGEIISIDVDSNLDGMNIVEFEDEMV